jgi:hypothetical protein
LRKAQKKLEREKRIIRPFGDSPPLLERGAMAGDATHQVTGLLQAWRGGDQAALDQLMPVIYAELRRLAHN